MERKTEFTKPPEEQIKEKLEKQRKEQAADPEPGAENQAENLDPEKILQMIKELQNDGLFRMNQLELMKSSINISLDFGNALFGRLDALNVSVKRIADAMGEKDGKKE